MLRLVLVRNMRTVQGSWAIAHGWNPRESNDSNFLPVAGVLLIKQMIASAGPLRNSGGFEMSLWLQQPKQVSCCCVRLQR